MQWSRILSCWLSLRTKIKKQKKRIPKRTLFFLFIRLMLTVRCSLLMFILRLFFFFGVYMIKTKIAYIFVWKSQAVDIICFVRCKKRRNLRTNDGRLLHFCVCVCVCILYPFNAQRQTYATKNKVNNDPSIQHRKYKANRNYIMLFMDRIYLYSDDVKFLRSCCCDCSFFLSIFRAVAV